MRLSKASLVEPGANSAYAITAVALSLFVFAYSSRFGQVSILLYYALWLPLVLVDYRRVLGNYRKYIWIFGFAVFACLSVFWSAAPNMTARTGLQYLSHVVCALIAMRVVDVRGLTLGGMAGAGIVLVYSLLFGVYHFDPLDGTFSFVGAFASKNQLGFYASLGILFAFAAVVTLGERRLWLPAAGGVGLLSAYSLIASQSATSVLSAAAVVALGLVLQGLMRLKPTQRRAIFMAAAVLAAAAAVAIVLAGGIAVVLGAFGKDATLTGRTYLWQQGIEAALRSPFVGVGYQAYWIQGFSEPERLWKEFFIGTRSGFHFHNTYIQAMVETGAVGLFLLATVLVVAMGGHLKRLLVDPENPQSMVLFSISILLLIRSFVEIDIMNPYHVGSFLLYFAAGKLTVARKRRARVFAVRPRDRIDRLAGITQPNLT